MKLWNNTINRTRSCHQRKNEECRCQHIWNFSLRILYRPTNRRLSTRVSHSLMESWIHDSQMLQQQEVHPTSTIVTIQAYIKVKTQTTFAPHQHRWTPSPVPLITSLWTSIRRQPNTTTSIRHRNRTQDMAKVWRLNIEAKITLVGSREARNLEQLKPLPNNQNSHKLTKIKST